jgi:hypothetical protein
MKTVSGQTRRVAWRSNVVGKRSVVWMQRSKDVRVTSIGGRTRRAVRMSNRGGERSVVRMNGVGERSAAVRKRSPTWTCSVGRRRTRAVWMGNVIGKESVVRMNSGTCGVVWESTAVERSRATRSG